MGIKELLSSKILGLNWSIKKTLYWGSQLIQLFLIYIIIGLFHIEENLGLAWFFPFVIIGFFFHSISPLKIRPILFFLSFLIVLYSLLGTTEASILLIIGAGLFSICHLPIDLKYRKLFIALCRIEY